MAFRRPTRWQAYRCRILLQTDEVKARIRQADDASPDSAPALAVGGWPGPSDVTRQTSDASASLLSAPQSPTEARPRGLGMSAINRPCRKMEMVPVDWETQRATAAVAAVMPA